MNQLLESLEYDPQRGSLSLQSARYLLMPPTLLMELQKNLEGTHGREAAQWFVEAGMGEGTALAGRFRDVFGYTADQTLGAVAFLLTESGWGTFALEILNLEGRELVFKVLDSPFAEVHGPSIQPVCHLVLGLLQGVGLVIFDVETTGMEVQCTAKGDSACRFVVSAR
jgi:predicted hydrocarbon binding protein